MVDPLPRGDYFALVCRGWKNTASVYAWTIRQKMPTINVPLLHEDKEVTLDLQKAFELTFERAAYDDTLNYHTNLVPKLSGTDQAWMGTLIG